MELTIKGDKEHILYYLQAEDYKIAITDFDQKLRNLIKYELEDDTIHQEIRDLLHEILNDYKLNPLDCSSYRIIFLPSSLLFKFSSKL